jgi:hypothetical protein
MNNIYDMETVKTAFSLARAHTLAKKDDAVAEYILQCRTKGVSSPEAMEARDEAMKMAQLHIDTIVFCECFEQFLVIVDEDFDDGEVK